ncbi:MAG TPA: diguanylate cyclase [Edaphobacter sp.]
MDYTTSHVFFLVCLGLFSVALVSLSVADRSVIGARWLAASTGVDFLKTLLQGLSGHLPRFVTVCVANELNVVAFFTMYLGLRWFVVRRPFTRWSWLLPLVGVMAVYPTMFLAHLRLWSFGAISIPVLAICGATVWMLLRCRMERFVVPARIAAVLLMAHMMALSFRVALSMAGYSAASVTMPWQDPRWMYSMLAIMLVAYCLLLMYALFTVLEMHSNVAHAAGVDALTGAVNRRELMKHAAREMARAESRGTPLSIVGMDLDHFKKLNDTFGHGGGDAALCAFVDLARERLRSSDVIARTGGEEFVLLLPGMDVAGATGVAESLRYSLEQMRVHYEGRMIVTTTSAGVTEMRANDSLAAMMKRADALLYRAKAQGRNCVVADDAVSSAHAKPMLVERLEVTRQSGKTA